MSVQRLDEWDPRRGRSGRPIRRLRQIVYAREICWLCGKPVDYTVPKRHPQAPSLDHRVPLSRGGHPTDLGNAELAHYGCNSSRGAAKTTSATRVQSRDYS